MAVTLYVANQRLSEGPWKRFLATLLGTILGHKLVTKPFELVGLSELASPSISCLATPGPYR